MNERKRAITWAITAVVVVTIMVAVLMLTGCSKSTSGTDTEVRNVKVGNKTVVCVVLKDIEANKTENAGIDCDWAAAK